MQHETIELEAQLRHAVLAPRECGVDEIYDGDTVTDALFLQRTHGMSAIRNRLHTSRVRSLFLDDTLSTVGNVLSDLAGQSADTACFPISCDCRWSTATRRSWARMRRQACASPVVPPHTSQIEKRLY